MAKYRLLLKYGVLTYLIFSSCFAWAKRAEFIVELKDHLFYPAEISIPAHQKVKLIIYNQDDSPEEFDSFALNREKVLFPYKKAVIYIGPLPPGRYNFTGKYHTNNAKGTVIVTVKKGEKHVN